MKLKQLPEDFQVEEVPAVAPAAEGPFAFYRMEKRGWATLDAVTALRRRWHIEPRRLSYGGLKDRHAQTVQYLTIHGGPPRDLEHHQVSVKYLGRLPGPYTSRDIVGNRFRITLRAMRDEERPGYEARLSSIGKDGVPNYFDDQRFGSVPHGGGEFVGRLLVRGQFEDALKLALAAPYEHDRGPQKQEKALLREHWGDWATLKDKLPRGHARSLVDYLRVHPADFKGAWARMRADLRSLYLSAYQSHLWNRVLGRWLTDRLRPEQLRPLALRLGLLPVPVNLDPPQREALASLVIPLPSSRLKLDEGHPAAEAINAVVAEEGLTLRDLQIRGLREAFFSKGERAAMLFPRDVSWEFAADELHPGRTKLALNFELPRGCYATLVVKAVSE